MKKEDYKFLRNITLGFGIISVGLFIAAVLFLINYD